MNKQPIGVFDSGIGGLTVLKKIIEILPNEKYIYYADTKHVPYGIKPKQEVIEYIKKAVDFLIDQNAKAIVIACNTATSIAINDLRENYNVPIIGIEPAAKPAVENRGNKKVLIMATPTTVKEEKLRCLLEKIEATDDVDLVAMPKLVEFAEHEEFETANVKNYIQNELKDYHLEDYSELVLGCTHFPFFKKTLSQIFKKETQIIDGSTGVAKRLRDVLKQKDLLGDNQLEIKYYYSGKLVEDDGKLQKLLEKLEN